MTSPNRKASDPVEVDRYGRVLAEMRLRFDQIHALPKPLDALSAEIACLHLRKVLELTVMSSLIANKDQVAAIASAFGSSDAARALKLVRRANADYWPQPVRQHRRGDGSVELISLESGFLESDDWGRWYGFLSEALHARNPFGSPLDLAHYNDQLAALHGRCLRLLEHHLLKVSARHLMLVGLLYVNGSDGVHVNVFVPVDPRS